MSNVIYVPPDSKIIEKMARKTCHKLAKTKNPVYRSVEVTEGVCEFLKIVADMKAQQLNAQRSTKEQHDASPSEKTTTPF